LNRGWLAGLLALAVVSAAEAQTESPFAGRTINFIIGTDVGGGYDAYGRLVATHLGRHLPGNPTIVAQNMPGAEGLKASNYLYTIAPKNGLAIGMVDQAVVLDQLLGGPAVEFDVQRFNWIGRVLRTTTVMFAWQTAAAKNAEDLRRQELIVASTGTAARHNYLAMNELAGTRLRIIGGYNGANASMLALERGEVEGMALLWVTVKQKDWWQQGKIRLLLQTALDRHPDLGDLPRMVDLARDEEARQVLALFSSPPSIGRSVLAPPGLPPETVAMLRRGFDAMLLDPTFTAQAEHMGLDIDALPGEALQKLVGESAAVSPAVVQRARLIAEHK
jgi:tripartite-type tricarboxylate transporter receptor subunit TctC